MNEDSYQFVIKRRKKSHQNFHGGAWKIALADFALAMMAFFLVMWLVESTSDEEKMAIAGYFEEPSSITTGKGGFNTPVDLEGSPESIVNIINKKNIEKEELSEKEIQIYAEDLEKEKLQILLGLLNQQINENDKLAAFKDQIMLDITAEGLRIQIVDKANRAMFSSGSDEMNFFSEYILLELTSTIISQPNKISITGHTDAILFTNRDDFSNWELSANRANAARRVLVEGGLPESQVAEVVGLSSSVLHDKTDPEAAINRRIEIIVLNKKTEEAISR